MLMILFRAWPSGVCAYNPAVVHTGIGYDVHRLLEGRPLWLGGVEIEHDKGLDGHSDADVLMHAICDAVLGALGQGDIGSFFPPSEPQWKDAPSRIFLEKAAELVAKADGKIVNIDATLIAEAPKILPHVPAMKVAVAQALYISPDQVGIKATTNELLGFLGREEGMAAMAVAGVNLPD
jgi:2-C-methyl-D-erythritol 2,4-cyclodiphosphate synthase